MSRTFLHIDLFIPILTRRGHCHPIMTFIGHSSPILTLKEDIVPPILKEALYMR